MSKINLQNSHAVLPSIISPQTAASAWPGLSALDPVEANIHQREILSPPDEMNQDLCSHLYNTLGLPPADLPSCVKFTEVNRFKWPEP